MRNLMKQFFGKPNGEEPSPPEPAADGSAEQRVQWMRQGHARHRAGDLDGAARDYENILACKPDDFDALYLLGTIHHARRQHAEAIRSIERAIASNPSIAIFHYELGAIYQETAAWAEAERCFRAAAALDPDYAEAHNDLGTVLDKQGRPEAAQACYLRALEIDPALPQAHYNLARNQFDRERFAEAEAHLRQVMAQVPDHEGTLLLLGDICQKTRRPGEAEPCYRAVTQAQPRHFKAHIGLSGVLSEQGRHREAETHFREAMRIMPQSAEAHFCLANCCQQLKRMAEAKAFYRSAIAIDLGYALPYLNLGAILVEENHPEEAIALYHAFLGKNPGHPDTHINLALAFSAQRRFTEAIDTQMAALGHPKTDPIAFSNLSTFHNALDQLEASLAWAQKAAALKPDFADAQVNVAYALHCLGREQESLAAYERAVAIAPDFADAQWGRALGLLSLGRYPEGWDAYEWRWKMKDMAGNWKNFAQPAWDGAGAPGKTLLLYAEQGLGDTLHFVRYAEEAAQRCGRVILLCQPPLKNLLRGAPGVGQVVADGEPLPPFDIQSPLLSLPRLLRTTLDTLPAKTPYLFPPAAARDRWRREIAPYPKDGGLRAGLVWAGGAALKDDWRRSCALQQFAPLAEAGGAVFFSLQKGPAAAQAATPPPGMRLIDLSARLNSFTDTAGLIDQLDLIISVDTAVAHLAGAMGKTTWTLLPFASDFRWLTQRSDTPWYPNMRLFRQPRHGDWDSVMIELAAALRGQRA
ncbi:MAG TPA: hypothetical protein DEP05_07140 [Betaproteobacteria bacterium]|nr:hypothetical protein [Betaproteobacteria bacterium]